MRLHPRPGHRGRAESIRWASDGRPVVCQPAWRTSAVARELIRGSGSCGSPAAHRAAAGPRRRSPAGCRGPDCSSPTRRNAYVLRFDPLGSRAATGAEMVASRLFHALLAITSAELHRSHQSQASSSRRRAGRPSPCAGRARSDRARHRPFLRAWSPGPRIAPITRVSRASDSRTRAVPRCSMSTVTIPMTWCRTSTDATSGACSCSARGSTTATCGRVNTRRPRRGKRHSASHYPLRLQATALGSGVAGRAEARVGGTRTLVPGVQAVGANVLGLGVYAHSGCAPGIDTARCRSHRLQTFDPDAAGRRITLIAPFVNRLPDDTFWAAKLVMAFTDGDIRAIVSTGQYSDPAAAAWLAECLIERRNRIGRAYLGRVLPLDNFRIENGELAFDDLGGHMMACPRPRTITAEWLRLRQPHWRTVSARARSGLRVPSESRRWRGMRGRAPFGWGAREDDHRLSEIPGRIVGGRGDRSRLARRVVAPQGIRSGAGPADTPSSMRSRRRSSASPTPPMYNNRSGRTYTSQEGFDALSLSQQTTFDAVTHALMRPSLTDEAGRPLGSPIDLLEGIDRIAGQIRRTQRRSAVPPLRPAEA